MFVDMTFSNVHQATATRPSRRNEGSNVQDSKRGGVTPFTAPPGCDMAATSLPPQRGRGDRRACRWFLSRTLRLHKGDQRRYLGGRQVRTVRWHIPTTLKHLPDQLILR